MKKREVLTIKKDLQVRTEEQWSGCRWRRKDAVGTDETNTICSHTVGFEPTMQTRNWASENGLEGGFTWPT